MNHQYSSWYNHYEYVFMNVNYPWVKVVKEATIIMAKLPYVTNSMVKLSYHYSQTWNNLLFFMLVQAILTNQIFNII